MSLDRDFVELRKKQRLTPTPKSKKKRASQIRIQDKEWICGPRKEYLSWLSKVDDECKKAEEGHGNEQCLVCGKSNNCTTHQQQSYNYGGYQAANREMNIKQERQFQQDAKYMDRADLRVQNHLSRAAHLEVIEVYPIYVYMRMYTCVCFRTICV